MSAIELAKYVERRMETLDLSVKTAAERSGISRQTWHKLRTADIKEAKLSTLMGVARTLKTTVPDLLCVYFQQNDRLGTIMHQTGKPDNNPWTSL